MSQLPEWRAHTHNVGQGSRAEAREGGREGGTGERRAPGRGGGSTKGFTLPLGWRVEGVSPFQTFPPKKNKKTQTHVKLKEQ